MSVTFAACSTAESSGSPFRRQVSLPSISGLADDVTDEADFRVGDSNLVAPDADLEDDLLGAVAQPQSRQNLEPVREDFLTSSSSPSSSLDRRPSSAAINIVSKIRANTPETRESL